MKFEGLEKYTRAVFKVCFHGGLWVYIFMMLLTNYHVVGRYGFDKPVLGLVELSGFAMITALFLLGAHIMMNKGHIAVGLIVDRLSERTQAIIDSITYIPFSAFALVAAWLTFEKGIFMIGTGETSAIMHIPKGPFFLIVGICWGLLGLAILIQAVHTSAKATKK